MTAHIEVFTTENCPYCPMAKDAVNEAKKSFSEDDVEVEFINANEDIEKIRKYNIMSVPTIVINEEVAFIGAPETSDLIEKIKEKI